MRRVFAPHLATEAGRGLWNAWRGTVRALWPLGGLSLGNQVEVLAEGESVFAAMWRAIASAEREVLMTTYTLEPDAVGERTIAELEAAARRGCRVTLVYDSIGSFRLADRELAGLRDAGGVAVAYNPFLKLRTRVSRLVRNHQKILVVDGEVGFCGGMNVAEEYAGGELGNGYFRDTHLALRGPCVADLARLVRGAAEEPTAESGLRELGPERTASEGSGCLVQILESNVRRQWRAIQRAMRMTLRRAVERCSFTTPYFVPPRRLMRALVRAAGRGVEVRILTAGRSDVPMVHWASQHLYERLLVAGVRIFELEARVLHAKTMAVDGVYAAVGSFNLDRWSDRRNLEVNVCVLDAGTAREIEAQFERDLEGAREVRLEEWRHRNLPARLLHWTAYQLMRL